MNRNIVDETSKEVALKISYLLPEEIENQIKKQTSEGVLNELRFMFFNRSEESLVRRVEKRMRELGFGFEPLFG